MNFNLELIIKYGMDAINWVVAHKDALTVVVSFVTFMLAPVVWYLQGIKKPIKDFFNKLGEKQGNEVVTFLKKISDKRKAKKKQKQNQKKSKSNNRKKSKSNKQKGKGT